MIRYALVCQCGHTFDSWFQGSDAFEQQARRRLIHCPACDATSVEKALMAPHLARTRKNLHEHRALPASSAPPATADVVAPKAPSPTPPDPPPPSAPASASGTPGGVPAVQAPAPVAMMSPQERELRAKLKELRAFITQNAEHVGARFSEEARKMHYGEIDHRSIYGEASLDEARALLDEGIDLHPLPPLPDDQN